VVLVDIDVPNQVIDPVYGQIVAKPMGFHSFGDGWMHPGGDAVLSIDLSAWLDLTLLGRDHRFLMVYTAHPKVVDRGMRGAVYFNGTQVADLEPQPNWALDTLEVHLPPGVVTEGHNHVELRTTDCLRQGEGGNHRWSLFVKSLRVDGRLDAAEQRRWASWTRTAEGARDRAVTIPGEVELGLEPPQPDPQTPDVVIILLDALRADRVGAWGYERDTTPHLDRLAEGGVALTSVFAEAPYTRSSVATLFTAHSWRDHQVLSRRDALGSHFTTLAEILQENGWSTLAVSDNPNVSRGAGSDQGFDEFVQAWSDVDMDDEAPGGWWPERPVVIWERRLVRGLDPERPVFAYLHLLPPHEPYHPGPDHDLFGPEGYEGPITGITPDIQAFDRGEYGSGTPDQERLESLYDGGLRRGDALLDRALRAWDAMGRSRPRLLVVISDHGEAFGEHGRYGHKSSVHREMTHVPVVFHPASLVPGAIANSPQALRSLGDLYPMLVHILGLKLPVGTTWPSRVLEVIEDPALPREELFVRCGQPRFGRRTANGLWDYQTGKARAYFDLAADPEAQVDLMSVDPDAWFEGLAAIRQFLASPLTSERAAPAEMTEEDRERLRALGYTGGR
jgi:arylsulfatase A-like enzyme